MQNHRIIQIRRICADHRLQHSPSPPNQSRVSFKVKFLCGPILANHFPEPSEYFFGLGRQHKTVELLEGYQADQIQLAFQDYYQPGHIIPPISPCRLCGCAVIWAAGQLRPQMQGKQQKFLRSVSSEHTQPIPVKQQVWLRLWRNCYHLTQSFRSPL